MNFDDVREISLKLPGTRPAQYYRMPAIKVGQQVLAVQTSYPSAEPNSISLPVGFTRRQQLISSNPRKFYLKDHYEPYPVVLVRLDCINRTELQRLLRIAHKAIASGAVIPGRRRSRTDKTS